MTTSDTHFWREIERMVGLPIQKAERMRWNKKYPGRLIELRTHIDTYIAAFPVAHGKHDAIWEVMRLIDNGDWPPNQKPPEGWPDQAPAAELIPADRLAPQPWVDDPLVREMPVLVQALVAARLQGTGICVDYAIAGALAVISAMCGNRVRFSTWGDTYHFPNIYLLLVGETSGSFKSSVGNKWVKPLLSEIDASSLAADEGSVEALIKDLSEHPSRLWIQDEFAGLLSSMKTRDYMKPIRELLLSLYDHVGIYRRHLARAQFQAQNPALSMLSTIQPAVMGEELFGGRNIDSGFVNRLLLVCGEGVNPYWPRIDDYSVYRQAIIVQLREMNRQPAVTAMAGDDVLELAQQWQGREEEEFGYYGKWVAARASIQALKLTALFQTAHEWPGGRRLSKEWMFVSLALLERWYRKSIGVIADVHIKQPGERDRRDFFALACHASHNKRGPQAIGVLSSEAQISKRKAEEHVSDLESRGWLSKDDDERLNCTQRSSLCEKAAAK